MVCYLRELKLLRHMEHENVIDMLDVFTPDQSAEAMNDLLVVLFFLCLTREQTVSEQLFSDTWFQH